MSMPAIAGKGSRALTAHSSSKKLLTSKPTKPKVFSPVIPEKLYLAQEVDPAYFGKGFRCISSQGVVEYHPLCDDFGPMNLVSIVNFIRLLEEEMEECASIKLVLVSDNGRRALTNSVFLLGAFLLLKFHNSAREISEIFKVLDVSQLEPYRDATYAEPNFELSLNDCWRGLERGTQNGWFQYPSGSPEQWGDINIDEYSHYENPLNGDLHEVVPGKFVAFKGPKDLQGKEFGDDLEGYRNFSPLYYVDIFNELGVTDVVRLNEPEYDASDFTDEGIAHHDLEFEDCTSPPDYIVTAFLRIADAAPGLVAVHCKAGLGRTGTLIARHMMRSHGFSAREAMGWLRIMRPGSVIGEQQPYLCAVDGSAPPAPPTAATPGTPPSRAPAAPLVAAPSAATLALQVATAMRRRSSIRNMEEVPASDSTGPGPATVGGPRANAGRGLGGGSMRVGVARASLGRGGGSGGGSGRAALPPIVRP